MRGWTRGPLRGSERSRNGRCAGAECGDRGWRIRTQFPVIRTWRRPCRPPPPRATAPARSVACRRRSRRRFRWRRGRRRAKPDTVHRHGAIRAAVVVPKNGSTVGVAQPIIINFPGRVDDAGAAIDAVHVSSIPPVPGKFYWMTPTQLRWRPLSFWPAHTAVTVDAGGTVSSFQTGDTLIATADDATHQLTVTRNGTVEKTIPMSMGMTSGNHQTPNGTYYVQEKMPSVVMDSSTYGVPVNSTYGYKVTVELAVRFDNVGDFVHSAPWSVDDQGKRDVSHGCINISPSNARWFFDNFGQVIRSS